MKTVRLARQAATWAGLGWLLYAAWRTYQVTRPVPVPHDGEPLEDDENAVWAQIVAAHRQPGRQP